MNTLNPDDRYHIEAHLGRELTAEELAKAPTLDELTREQLDVVARLEGRGILAIAYIRAVVPSAEWSDAREFVIDIQDFLPRNHPPAHLKMEHLYGRALGRRLTEEERRVVSTIADLTRTQAAVVRQLASVERVHGLLYLADVVESAVTREREAFIDWLLRDGAPP